MKASKLDTGPVQLLSVESLSEEATQSPKRVQRVDGVVDWMKGQADGKR